MDDVASKRPADSASVSSPPSLPSQRRRPRWLRNTALVALVPCSLVGVLVAQGYEAFGRAPAGERLVRMEQSAQYRDGVFVNPEPLYNDYWGMLMESGSDDSVPGEPLPVVEVDPLLFDTPPESGLRVTWLGHSTLLVEIDGRRVLTDPVWGERTSPYTWVGPLRWYPPPIALEKLPKLDAVVISHDHYDHLDYPTMKAMREVDTVFVAPLGVGAHLAYWGIPHTRIIELDWWEGYSVADLRITATPARHASGRHLFDQDHTLWAGYALQGSRHRVFFSGDTGLFPAMSEIGERLGPFDLTMIEVGAYGKNWPDWHLGPEQAVRAHGMLRGAVMLPVHWGLFDLALHSWTEPIERVRVAADGKGVRVAAPRPGESFEPELALPSARWWANVPWRTEEQYPIVATRVPR